MKTKIIIEKENKDLLNTRDIIEMVTVLTKLKKFNYELKKNKLIIKIDQHVLDFIHVMTRANLISTYKITFKIDGINHFYYIGLPY